VWEAKENKEKPEVFSRPTEIRTQYQYTNTLDGDDGNRVSFHGTVAAALLLSACHPGADVAVIIAVLRVSM
jgi:hypothetical protein